MNVTWQKNNNVSKKRQRRRRHSEKKRSSKRPENGPNLERVHAVPNKAQDSHGLAMVISSQEHSTPTRARQH